MATIQGTIEGVMETWPLQLTVAAGGMRYLVTLTDSTAIRRAGRPADARSLRPGFRVAVSGERPARGGANLLVAAAITVFEA